MTLDTSSISVHAIEGGIELRTETASAGLSRAEPEQLVAFLRKVVSGKNAGNAFNDANDHRKLEIADHGDYIELMFIRDNMAGTVMMHLDKAKVSKLLEQVNKALGNP